MTPDFKEKTLQKTFVEGVLVGAGSPTNKDLRAERDAILLWLLELRAKRLSFASISQNFYTQFWRISFDMVSSRLLKLYEVCLMRFEMDLFKMI